MTVIPLVVSLLITGVASATDIKAIGRLGGATLLVFGLLLGRDGARRGADPPCRLRAAAPRPASASAAARRRRGGGADRERARPDIRRLDHVARSGQPDRGRGQRSDGATDRLHACSWRSRSRVVAARRAHDTGRVLPGVRRRDARAGPLGDRCGADRRIRAGVPLAAHRAPGSPGPSGSTSPPTR